METEKTFAALTGEEGIPQLQKLLPPNSIMYSDPNPDVRRFLSEQAAMGIDVVVIFDDGMPYKDVNEADVLSFLSSQKSRGTQLIFVAGAEREPGDEFIRKLISAEVYDIVGPAAGPDAIAGIEKAVQSPASYADCARWLEPEEAKKNIGYLPEIPPLYMEMTVREYLEFAAELKGIKKDKRESQIEEVIRLAKLRDVENRLIQNLSKGYKQRVGLAQAVLGFPEIIILDEPTVGLDPKQIIEIRELIRKLAKKHTVILSSHILAEVREVCDYIMIISGGKLVASDTTENLENMMSGKGQIEVEAKASRDEMDHIIRRTGKIKEVKYRTSASSITTAQIIAKGGEDIREELFLAFSHADVPMLTLSQSKTTLEEIFLELTQGSGNRMIKEEK